MENKNLKYKCVICKKRIAKANARFDENRICSPCVHQGYSFNKHGDITYRIAGKNEKVIARKFDDIQ